MNTLSRKAIELWRSLKMPPPYFDEMHAAKVQAKNSAPLDSRYTPPAASPPMLSRNSVVTKVTLLLRKYTRAAAPDGRVGAGPRLVVLEDAVDELQVARLAHEQAAADVAVGHRRVRRVAGVHVEPVEQEARRQVVGDEHVVGVVGLVPARVVVAQRVAADEAGVVREVARVGVGRAATREGRDDRDAVDQVEARVARVDDRRRIGRVEPAGDVDRLPADRDAEGVVERRVCAAPARAVVDGTGRVLVDVDHRRELRVAERSGGEQGEGDEYLV